ncbi:MAG: AAA family ATPase [Methanomassiliicoccaceae archaeon]|jgi:adenosylcobyric acid synthase|nr:AAA family ATPase [Methanomassiliicoccaceae archaeon]
MKIIFLGTSSNAGKTLMSALLCRYLRSKMIMVSPFKALNLSSRSFATDDGSEIGVGQALQAWASDIRPHGRMNPILIRSAGGRFEVIANGAKKGTELKRGAMLPHAQKAFDELCDLFDAIVAEGSGSPAEINLRETDVANMNFAVSRNIPAILIADIEKGGVFAGIYGTWRLMSDEGKALMKGFIINKYYGDRDILRSGIERIEELTGMRCMGVLPHMMGIPLPEEDAPGKYVQGEEDIDRYVDALDRMLENINDHVDMDGILRMMEG